MSSKKESKTADHLIYSGCALILVASVLFALIYKNALLSEVGYILVAPTVQPNVAVSLRSDVSASSKDKPTIIAADQNFSIIVPKIGANSPVVADVDPFNETEYQIALTRGVAHALGTSNPSKPGNMFLFAHSSGNFYEASQYNSVFYLLRKLEQEDPFYVVYDGEIYKYKVTKKEVVEPEAIEYLDSNSQSSEKTVTLMTCWPPGTTVKRLLVHAVQQ